ncbi:MAG: DUF447 domain-containing protein [Planctomycetia bacterium]
MVRFQPLQSREEKQLIQKVTIKVIRLKTKAVTHLLGNIMILEGLVTTVDEDGKVHVAPMGPRVDSGMQSFLLRPYPSSNTCKHLMNRLEGVLHVTDDVTLIAQGAIGKVVAPECFSAKAVAGFVLKEACRAYEFQVSRIDTSEERVRLECKVLEVHHLRDFFGFNRAKHAVIEAAILASRTAFLNPEDILAEFRKLSVIVQKTGADREISAFSLLENHVTSKLQEKLGHGG